MKEKICNKCGVSKEVNLVNFGFQKAKNIFRVTCRICNNKKAKEYRDSNLQDIRMRARVLDRNRYKNPDKRANKNARMRQWYLDNPEKKREYTLRRKLQTMENHSDEWVQILLKDPCTYCGKSTEALDHSIPVSRGGTNDVTNLTGTCKTCNSSKKDKTFLEFLIERQKEFIGDNYA